MWASGKNLPGFSEDAFQVPLHQPVAYVPDRSALIDHVVERHRGAPVEEGDLVVAVGPDGVGELPDVVRPLDVLVLLRADPHGAFVRAGPPSMRPDDQNGHPVVALNRDLGNIRGYDGVAQLEQLLLDARDGVRVDPGVVDRLPVDLSDADYDVPSPEVVDVVGEGADRMQNLLGVPALFELDAAALDDSPLEELSQVDRYHGITSCAFSYAYAYAYSYAYAYAFWDGIIMGVCRRRKASRWGSRAHLCRIPHRC